MQEYNRVVYIKNVSLKEYQKRSLKNINIWYDFGEEGLKKLMNSEDKLDQYMICLEVMDYYPDANVIFWLDYLTEHIQGKNSYCVI